MGRMSREESSLEGYPKLISSKLSAPPRVAEHQQASSPEILFDSVFGVGDLQQEKNHG